MKIDTARLPAALVVLALSILSPELSTLCAQNTVFTYQGRVTDNGTNFTGIGQFKFALVTSNANLSATTYWSNDGTSVNGSQPSAAVAVGVNNGLFTVVLGDTTQPNMAAIPATLFNQTNLQLQIWFNDGVNGSAALSPVQNLTPAPYAIFAGTAGSLNNGLTVQNNTNGSPNVIGGSSVNFVSSGVYGATIGGGYSNAVNSVTADFGTIGGGADNTVSGWGSTVGGGGLNTASSPNGSATVAGGYGNTASGDNSTVAGGNQNTASGDGSTVGGGYDNIASGVCSFAAGLGAQALNDYSFVWSDGSVFSSTAENQFAVHANGGVLLAADVQIGTGSGDYHHLTMGGGNSSGFLYGSYPKFQDFISLGYNYYADANGNQHIMNPGGGSSRVSVGYGEVIVGVGGTDAQPTTTRIDVTTAGVTVYGTFNNNSDRNAKQDFAAISPAQMLEKVSRLPISEWSYKEDAATRHVGPVAQDFHSIFNIGTDDKHIAPIDEGGVALAAIQGLNQKLEAENVELKQENNLLAKRMDELEAKIKTLVETSH